MQSYKRTFPTVLFCFSIFTCVSLAVNATGMARQKRMVAQDLSGKYQAKRAKVPDLQSKERVVHFPKDKSIGSLQLVNIDFFAEDRSWHRFPGDEKLGDARGDIRVPANKMLRLDVNKNAWKGERAFYPRIDEI